MSCPLRLLLRMVVLSLALGPGGCADTDERPVVTVFAATSLTDVLGEIARQFEATHPLRVRLNFAASSTLARQIDAGAAADVFVSANPQWMEYLGERGRLEPSRRLDIARNTLVLAVPQGRGPVALASGADPDVVLPGRVAIGDPEHVPAGMYARQALETLGWYDKLAGRLITAPDVRAALRLLELGEADAAIVYATDARASARPLIAARFDPAGHEVIRYPAALVRGAPDHAAAFLDYLRGPEARAALSRAGFDTGSPSP